MRQLLLCAIVLGGCSRSNNLLLGRVEEKVGTHVVIVTDCYRTEVTPPYSIEGGYQFVPCRDADIVIRAEQLTVNGKSYGRLNRDDEILVDHGVVSIGRREARAR